MNIYIHNFTYIDTKGIVVKYVTKVCTALTEMCGAFNLP